MSDRKPSTPNPAPSHPRTRLRERKPTHVAGLVSRVAPLIVLGVGSLWWMTHLELATAQYPQQNFQQNGYGQNNFQPAPAQFNSGIPTIPASTAIPSAQPPADAVSDPELAAADAEADAGAGWQLPGILGKFAEGGWLMLPLAFCSLVVFALSLERLVALRRGRVIPRPFVRRFTECVEDGQLSYEEATEICEEFDCPVAEVFQAAVRRWGRPMFEIEQAVMDAGDRVADGLRRFVRVFHAISNVAPLLGLLGTVLGMIEAFETISSQESIGRPEMLASGISTALMTTAGGLMVAIPAYLAYMYFSSKSDRYLGEIDKLCQRVVDCISAEGLENSGNARPQRKRRAA
ncbi:biopolymer transport ExbB-related protein [Rhodopirellula maiorica SM1]|uniref:Biopolymer transport ExbB-related protein n=1 Tax=Rhodopirellula maiorica SM1 TaxID=1265738 RepID=M5S5U4_9BACT|nr:MotA/TolQ/ExbB proton channel family protein [Rhodopirellula maiorica]EMI23032.1 biopolymer transport ExbB-related protein [Rhodopirellula maiorica SM1]